jgi:hypothetical protein
MNKNLLLYGALGFLVVRYLMKKRQNAALIDSTQLPDTPDYIRVSRRRDEPRDGFMVEADENRDKNNPNNGSSNGNQRKQF